ncbi:hypothetical protein [Lysobacter terrae]
MSPGKSHLFSKWILIACGFWLIGLGFYFVLMRPALLPEDIRFMGTTPSHVRSAVPGLEDWLRHVFVVLGGFIAGAGVLTVYVAATALPARRRGTAWAIALSGAFTVALMSAMNFSLQSDFRWLLLVPAVAWVIGLVSYICRH